MSIFGNIELGAGAFVDRAIQLSNFLTLPNKASRPNITDFIGYFDNAAGFARPTRYRVDIGLQQLLNNDAMSIWLEQANITDVRTADRLAFFCSRAVLPAKVFRVSDVRTYGPTYQLPYQGQYPNVILEFYVGQDMLEKKFFDAWMYGIEDPTTMDISYLNDFSTNIVISELTEFSSNVEQGSHHVLLLNAWPISVNQMDLSFDAINQYHKIQVSFAYKKWISGDVDINTANSVVPRGAVGNFAQNIGTPQP